MRPSAEMRHTLPSVVGDRVEIARPVEHQVVWQAEPDVVQEHAEASPFVDEQDAVPARDDEVHAPEPIDHDSRARMGPDGVRDEQSEGKQSCGDGASHETRPQ